MRFLKTQLNIWQSGNLTFKIAGYSLKLYVFKKASTWLQFWKSSFLFFQIAIFKKRNFQTIHFLQFGLKSHFFVYEIATSNTHLLRNLLFKLVN
jgi:hypothetical protein